MTAALFAATAVAQPAPWQALDRLKNDLNLSPAQEEGWDAFAGAYNADPQEVARVQHAQASMSSMNGPQRVDAAIGMAEQNLAALKRRGNALKTFYATLSPDQQRTFDRDTLPPGPDR